MSIYDFKLNSIDGEETTLNSYKGKVLLIVNTASKCGFTPQYEGLEALYTKYSEQNFEILGFPSNQFAEQEPGTNSEVKNFCLINYGVSFPLFEKIDVRGENIHPLFKYLTENTTFNGFDLNHPIGQGLLDFLKEKYPEFLDGNSIKWNFTKFLLDKEGNIVKRYESTTEPAAIEKDIQNLL